MNAGIKAVRKDLALVFSERPCVAAGCFTVNKACAHPVKDAMARLPSTVVRAIVVNSGNANALVGPEGDRDVRAVCDAVGAALGVHGESVLAASTGVIGVRLPVKKLVDAAEPLARARGAAIALAAEAILTTDTRVKLSGRTLKIGAREVCVAAFAKGSGMIAPELATMLAFITTDANVTPDALQAALSGAMESTFNSLTVDDDMSTNDAVFALANGAADNDVITPTSASFPAFAEAIRAVCTDLARAIAEDGEGATKLLEIVVRGAPDVAIARDLAKSIAGSNLTKAAMFGADPNWGRVLAVVGARAGSRKWEIDPTCATVRIQSTVVYENGAPTAFDALALRAKMREPRVDVEVVLGERGAGEATAWGCDLSYDYVKINADYTSLTSAAPDGTVSRDDRLTNYSPGFKRALLVEALSYIAKFTNKRAVIKYGGAAMVKDSLKASFANDVNLLRYAGLLPIVVHGGGPEITHTLEKLGGGKSEFVDGVRVTGRDDVKVVEMVLTGKINTELVSLLNQSSTRAVGVSGKDAGTLRAKKLVTEGRDLGMVGEVTSVNTELLETLLEKKYVPVVSPVGLGEDGEGYNINADAAAAEIAIALKSDKLIYLTDVAGILENGELVSEISASEVRAKIASGTIRGGMVAKVKSALRAIEGGVERVHIIDGRTPHSAVAELFTDRGVGTLIKRD